MINPTFWNQILVWPILNLLIGLYVGFSFLQIPGALGFAIIALTVIIRILLTPLTHAQLRSAKKMQELKPRLDELNKKHKGDKVKLQQAQMALYKEMGVNPAAGCLPLLVQFPVFIALYSVFTQILGSGNGGAFVSEVNKVLYFPWLHITKLNLSFFGLDLAIKPNQWQTHGVLLLAIPLITGALQYLQTRLMTTPTPKAVVKPNEEDQMQAIQKQMTLIMPIMIGVFALSFPVGLALYWNIFTLFGIMQQLYINKKG